MSALPDSKAALTGPGLQEPILGSRAGHLTGLDGSGVLLIDFPGNTAGPVPARLATRARVCLGRAALEPGPLGGGLGAAHLRAREGREAGPQLL